MIEKIKKLYTQYKELILYVVFGGLTTAVNYIIYIPFLWLFKHALSSEAYAAWENGIIIGAQICAWIAAVLFAFITNKNLVFQSKDNSKASLFRQLTEFAGARLLSLGIETVLLLLFVSVFSWNEYISKLIVSVITVILNYFASKFIIFRKKG